MNKIGWLICIIGFVFVTVFVLALDNSVTQTRRVKISNQNFEITHENTELANNDSVKINLAGSNISNKQIDTHNTDVDINNSSQVSNTDVKFSNISDFENRNVGFENAGSYDNQNTNFEDGDVGLNNSNNINYDNLDDSHLDVMLENAKNLSTAPKNKSPRQRRYMYQQIDWSTWKSNFVNRILDESLAIKELDQYGNGTWFYYSFIVDDQGRISNINVSSMYLDPMDKEKVVNLIKSLEYDDITLFPPNTQRKTAKVSAIMMLSSETKKSNPRDFQDIEQVKFQIDN